MLELKLGFILEDLENMTGKVYKFTIIHVDKDKFNAKIRFESIYEKGYHFITTLEILNSSYAYHEFLKNIQNGKFEKYKNK